MMVKNIPNRFLSAGSAGSAGSRNSQATDGYREIKGWLVGWHIFYFP
jgi:hypothetical protein